MYSTKDFSFKLSTIILILVLIIGSHRLFSQEISTVAEIYNFKVGDIFHRENSEFDLYGGFYELTNETVISKEYSTSGGGQTLYYIFDVACRYQSSEDPNFVYSTYTDTLALTNLYDLINLGNIDSVYSSPELYNGRIINYYQIDFFEGFRKYRFVEGCGVVFYDYMYGAYAGGAHKELLYYYKNGEEWGTPNIAVSTNENEVIQENIRVFPNPASDYITIKNNKAGSGKLEILSLTGETIQKVNFFSNQKLNISELVPGLYVLKIKQDDQQLFKKLIKK